MGGQVLGGGVIVLIAVLLWLVYLLPTWQSKMRYNAAERNAVRLGQALRVLAETSEAPEEVHVELTARQTHAQQKLARRVQADQERLAKQQEQQEYRLQTQKHRAELDQARAELARWREEPAQRRARARRGVRMAATCVLLAGVTIAGFGIWQLVAVGSWLLLAGGTAGAVLGAALLHQMSRVAARSARHDSSDVVAPVQTERAAGPLLDAADRGWQPRPLPEPLTERAGSRAATAQAGLDAQQALRQAAHDQELRERAAQLRPEDSPISIEQARPAAGGEHVPSTTAEDAALEEHVRRLLARRSAS